LDLAGPHDLPDLTRRDHGAQVALCLSCRAWRASGSRHSRAGHHGRTDTPKRKLGKHKIAIDPYLASELAAHRSRSNYKGEDEYVFCSHTGRPIDLECYGKTFRAALKRGIGISGEKGTDRWIRPFHEGKVANPFGF
jgi:hypothetical protein